MDLDGFASRLEESPLQLFKDFQSHREEALSRYWKAQVAGFPLPEGLPEGFPARIQHPEKLLWPYTFSDSWFFCTIDASEESFRQISSAAAGMWFQSLVLGLPARGAIACGPIWWNASEQIVLGKPLAAAARLAGRLEAYGIAIEQEIPHVDGATTEFLSVPVRDGSRVATTALRFALLRAAWAKNAMDATEALGRLKTLESAYAAKPGALERVRNRYRATPPIADRMLAPGHIPKPAETSKDEG